MIKKGPSKSEQGFAEVTVYQFRDYQLLSRVLGPLGCGTVGAKTLARMLGAWAQMCIHLGLGFKALGLREFCLGFGVRGDWVLHSF